MLRMGRRDVPIAGCWDLLRAVLGWSRQLVTEMGRVFHVGGCRAQLSQPLRGHLNHGAATCYQRSGIAQGLWLGLLGRRLVRAARLVLLGVEESADPVGKNSLDYSFNPQFPYLGNKGVELESGRSNSQYGIFPGGSRRYCLARNSGPRDQSLESS